MPKSKKPTYIDPMEDMIAQIRQEERYGAKIDFVLEMINGGEPDEKIAKYARLDIEKVREARAVYENMVKAESELKSRALIFRYEQINDFKITTDRMIEGMDIPRANKRHLLQMLGYDPRARSN